MSSDPEKENVIKETAMLLVVKSITEEIKSSKNWAFHSDILLSY